MVDILIRNLPKYVLFLAIPNPVKRYHFDCSLDDPLFAKICSLAVASKFWPGFSNETKLGLSKSDNFTNLLVF